MSAHPPARSYTPEEIAAKNAICRAKPRGDYGKIEYVGYPENGSNTFPTKFTVQIKSAIDGSLHRGITLWAISVVRECGPMPQYGYVDPDTGALWFLTFLARLDVNGNIVPRGSGFVTYNDDGAQTNKVAVEGAEWNITYIMDPSGIRQPTASDGSQIVVGMSLGNPNWGQMISYSDEVKQDGGRRKTRRSKKSKKHTRR